jgi:transposase InsO family protein
MRVWESQKVNRLGTGTHSGGRTGSDGATDSAYREAVGSGPGNHSDRGVQYASQVYTEMLRQRRATISMSHKGNS